MERLSVRPRLTYQDKEYMLASLLRVPVLFAQAKSLLTQKHFSIDDSHYSAIWTAALKLASEADGSLPSGIKTRLEIETKKETDNDGRVTPEMAEELFRVGDGLFDWMFNIPDSDLSETHGAALLRCFLEESEVVDKLKTTAAELGNNVPQDLNTFLKELTESYNQIRAVGVDPVLDPWSGVNANHGIGIHSTGIAFFDDLMAGGCAPGESYTLLGATGVGKTSTGIQIAVEGARQEMLYAKGDHSDPNLGHWYHFFYEYAVNPEIYFRVWSYAARIHRDTLWKEFIPDMSNFSTTGNYKPYELDRFAAEIKLSNKPPGEMERWQAAKNELCANLHLVDMSGSDINNPKSGAGWVEEIAAVLRREHDKGRRIAGIVIDDAATMTERYLAEHDLASCEKTAMLNRLVMDVNRLCAGPYKLSAWVIHQIAGAANNRASSKAMHHTDAEGSKSFPKNAWFAFQLGTKDTTYSTCILSCSKSRRANATGRQHIVFVDGEFCAILSGDNKYAIDPQTKRIMLKSDVGIMTPHHKAVKPFNNPSLNL